MTDQTAFTYQLDVVYTHQSAILLSTVIKYLILQIIQPRGTLCQIDDAKVSNPIRISTAQCNNLEHLCFTR